MDIKYISIKNRLMLILFRLGVKKWFVYLLMVHISRYYLNTFLTGEFPCSLNLRSMSHVGNVFGEELMTLYL